MSGPSNDSPDWFTEVFGSMAARPDHPDLVKLSEVLLRMDSGLDPALPDDDKQAIWEARIREIGIDPKVVSWAGIQRAMRVTGTETQVQFMANAQNIMRMSSTWLDGFMAGAFWREKKAAAGE